MPLPVMIAGGPHSVRSLSKKPFRGDISCFNSPFLSSTGFQSTRLVDVAANTCNSPQYIQYLPLILAMTWRPPSSFVYIEADLCGMLKNLPWYAFLNMGPCFTQVTKSLDVATPKRGTFRFHCV